MNILLSDNFETKLGTIQTRIESTDNRIVFNANNSINTESHKIKLQAFELKTDWMQNHCESSMVWRWFIEKISDAEEQLAIFCELINPQADVSCNPNSGEHLDAVEIENETYHLHIGTEDGEIMNFRAMRNRLDA